MTGPNGAGEPRCPLVLVLSGGQWFIGRDTVNGLADPCEYHGAVQARQTAPDAVEVRVVRVVQPCAALASLPLLAVEGPRVPLTDLSHAEQREIEREYGRAQDMLGSLRAQQAGIVQPRLVLPPGVGGGPRG
jgi:hypothetical protein